MASPFRRNSRYIVKKGEGSSWGDQLVEGEELIYWYGPFPAYEEESGVAFDGFAFVRPPPGNESPDWRRIQGKWLLPPHEAIVCFYRMAGWSGNDWEQSFRAGPPSPEGFPPLLPVDQPYPPDLILRSQRG